MIVALHQRRNRLAEQRKLAETVIDAEPMHLLHALLPAVENCKAVAIQDVFEMWAGLQPAAGLATAGLRKNNSRERRSAA
ncbi:MAG: hypothetical protein WBW33_06495 [Bryobacteraceae bacterium]